MTDDEKKSLSSAYVSLMQMPAWIDLEKYAWEERELSFKRMDAKSATDLALSEVCEERGIRKGIMKILQHAEFRKQGV